MLGAHELCVQACLGFCPMVLALAVCSAPEFRIMTPQCCMKGTPLAITGKQVRQLRSLAHHLDPIVFIGKLGITPTIVSQTNALLEGKELIKCTVQNTSDLDTQEAAFMLADATESEMIQVIGHKFVLYRESKRDDIEHIQLV